MWVSEARARLCELDEELEDNEQEDLSFEEFSNEEDSLDGDGRFLFCFLVRDARSCSLFCMEGEGLG